MNQPSIFTEIINGEIPCHKVYEDELTLAFLDIHPIGEFHTLVIPKKQIEFVWDLEDSDYQAVMRTVQKVGRRIREVSDKQYVGQVVVGTDVPHAHIHVVPFDTASEIKRTIDGPGIPADAESLAAAASKLYFE